MINQKTTSPDLSRLVFSTTSHWSTDYRKTIYLRYKLLRQPLGLKFSASQFQQEDSQIHIIGKLDDQIIACLIFIPLGDNTLRMRQVCVANHLQGYSIGQKMVQFAEAYVQKLGFTSIILHARNYVIPFYKKLGYQICGQEFIEVNIPHHKMCKDLSLP